MVHRWFIAGSLWFITYYVWFIAGSLLVHRWFIEFLSFFIEVVSFSYLKPGHILSSFSVASKQNLHQKVLLSKRFLSPGSSLVHCWFIAGSLLVHCWLMRKKEQGQRTKSIKINADYYFLNCFLILWKVNFEYEGQGNP